MFAREVTTAVAGRTDAGVHALGQVVSTADAPNDLDLSTLRDKLNGMLGPEIAVAGVTPAPEDFDARFSARSRCYVYALRDAEVPDPFLSRTTWQVKGRLDVEAMNEAAGHLIGEQDFRSFGRLPAPDASPVRRLYELRCTRADDLIRIRARANAFIQQMVRSLVGTLVEVGAGKRSPDQIPAVLGAHDRAAAGPVAPSKGLCLVGVEYDEGWSRPLGENG